MTDREIVLIISIALLIVFIIYQRAKISTLLRSVDGFMEDLEAEQLLRAAEAVVNKALLEQCTAEKDKKIELLKKALDGSERARKELAARYLEDVNV